jgi:2-amino-4-hydroxy-6-hydroxymethyldihydropteridine diphosphokinase
MKNIRPVEILLALGSNLGDRRKILESAWKEIGNIPEIKTLRLSRFYETKPVGGPTNQPEFLNAAGIVAATLPPQQLLEQLQEIENRFGRVRTEHWGPRTLDIDILFYGNKIISTPTLTIPHPEMLQRRFVLEPAEEIAANTVHPITGQTIRQHLHLLK